MGFIHTSALHLKDMKRRSLIEEVTEQGGSYRWVHRVADQDTYIFRLFGKLPKTGRCSKQAWTVYHDKAEARRGPVES